jgi:poly-gamma-glutamate synthesis protein (capsule biosynthesis protein)
MVIHDNMDEWIIDCGGVGRLSKEASTEILFLGDVALAGQVGDVILQHGREFLFNELPADFFDVDVVCFNLECCLSERGKPWEPKPIPFRGLPRFLSVFPKTGCTYVASVANNHFLDYGEDAAIDTLEAIRSYGMRSIGATGEGADGQHIILKTSAGNVGLIGFAPSAHPLPNTSIVNLPGSECVSDMVSRVNSLKRQSDVVVALLHHGVENTHLVDRHSRDLSHSLVDAGADCIVCHHPHVIQGIETYKGAQIFHSIGNFVIDLNSQRRASARKSLALRLVLHEKRLHKIIVEQYIIMKSLQPRPATAEEKREIRIETEALSSRFDSKLKLNVDYLTCEGIKIGGQVSSLCKMIRQKGVSTTAKYYYERIMDRAKHRD